MTFHIQVKTDDRDLTNWLVRQLNANLHDLEIPEIRRLNILGNATAVSAVGTAAAVTMTISSCNLPSAVLFPPSLLLTLPAAATRGVVTGAPLGVAAGDFKLDAGARWVALVKDMARYDYKHVIDAEMGRAIRLCHSKGCTWLDYSVPGNINYAYIGRAAGFSGLELYAGAGYAEVCDPAHRLPGEKCWERPFFNQGAWFSTGFDDPQDRAAIDLGLELYRLYPVGFTEHDFKQLLAKFVSQLAIVPPRDIPRLPYTSPYGTNYPLGHFDGPL